jgi:hypothetical protein
MDYTDDSQLPEISDERLQRALQTTRPYTLVILRPGPRFQPPGPGRDPEVAATVLAHGRRNLALHTAGLLAIVCPVVDGSGVTGVGVFDASFEDTDRIMANDPGVQAGIFAYDLHPTRSFPGSHLPP